MISRDLVKAFVISITFVLTGKTYAQTIDNSLELMVSVAQQELDTPTPTRFDPLALNARLVWSETKDQVAIVMKVNLLTGWHIYSSVSRKSPFIATKIKLTLPEEGITPIGEWEEPTTKNYNEEAGVYVGEELFFVGYYKVDKNLKPEGTLKCGLYYQACDPYKCFPPKTKMVDLTF